MFVGAFSLIELSQSSEVQKSPEVKCSGRRAIESRSRCMHVARVVSSLALVALLELSALQQTQCIRHAYLLRVPVRGSPAEGIQPRAASRTGAKPDVHGRGCACTAG